MGLTKQFLALHNKHSHADAYPKTKKAKPFKIAVTQGSHGAEWLRVTET